MKITITKRPDERYVVHMREDEGGEYQYAFLVELGETFQTDNVRFDNRPRK